MQDLRSGPRVFLDNVSRFNLLPVLTCVVFLTFFGVVQTVSAAPATTTTTLTITSNGGTVATVQEGSVVTLTAAVKAGATPAKVGQVNFCDATAAHCTDIHLLGTEQLTSAGTAIYRFVPGPGNHSYKAVFLGTGADAGSFSASEPLAVTAIPEGKFATTTAISESGAVSPFTLTATVVGKVNSASVPPPTGTVSFLDTSNVNNLLGSTALGAGTAALNWTNFSTPFVGDELSTLAVADINGDGHLDLAISDTYGGAVTILLGHGDGTFATEPVLPSSTTTQAIAVGDFNGDGRTDLAILAPADPYSPDHHNYVKVFPGHGDGTFGTAWTYDPGTGTNATSIAVGDFNGDGKADLAMIDFVGKKVIILLGKGDGTFSSVSARASTGLYPGHILMADFNGDGKPDLAVMNGGDNNVTILLGNGDGTFTPAAVKPATGYGPVSMVVADFNGDGKADLALTHISNTTGITILLGNGDGTFASTSISPVVAGSYSTIAVGDFNGDGKADLVLTDFYSKSISVLLGNGNGTFTASPSPVSDAYPWVVATGDFNEDGKSDLVVNFYPDNVQGSHANLYLAQFTASATATVTGIALTGTHRVEARYPGDHNYASSVSSLITLPPPVAATPTFSPAAGGYLTPQSVTIKDSTPNTTIYYTVDGTAPTNHSTMYVAPIYVSSAETIKAVAIAPNFAPSAVGAAAYTIGPHAATPSFSPAPGTYTTAQTVKLTSATSGATIYYTLNGSTPTTASTKYTSTGIKVSVTTTIKAIATASGHTSSPVASGTFTLPTAPSVTTKAATGLSTLGATLNATVTANNATTQYWFVYGTSSTSLARTTAKTGALTGTAATAVTDPLRASNHSPLTTSKPWPRTPWEQAAAQF